MGGRNTEGYPDPTANTAVGQGNERKKRSKKKEAEKRCSYQSETQEWTKSLTVRI